MNSEQGKRNVRPARAHQPGEAQDFPGVQIEFDAREDPFAAEPAHPADQLALAAHAGVGAVKAVDRPPHHVADQQVPGDLGFRAGGDVPAVAQNGDPVGDLEHFLKPVADEENGHAPIPQLARGPEQLPHLVIGKRRGRLVHDQDFDFERNRLRDFHRLLRSERQASGRRANVELDAEAGKYLLGLRVHPVPCDQRALVAMGDEDVLRDIQIGKHQRLLVNRGDSEGLGMLGVRELHRRALHSYLSFVGLLDSGQYLDKRGFARAVLSYQGMDFPGAQIQGNLVQRLRHVESLGQRSDLQNRDVAARTPGFRRRIHLVREGRVSGGGAHSIGVLKPA